MSIVIKPQVLNASAEMPISIDVSTVSNNEIKVSTISKNPVNISASAYSNNYQHLINKPKINDVTLEGNLTSKELNIKEDANFLFTQTTASNIWVIVHNLNKYPSVTVLDSAGNEVIGETIYNDLNQVTLKFKGGFKGTATLN